MLPTRPDLLWIRRFRRGLVGEIPRLQAICRDELDRPEFETLMTDLVPLLDSCKWHERHARRVLRTRKLRGGGLWRIGQRHDIRRRPIGRVAIIGTWNYPYQLLGVQLVQAIAAGNDVVVKPSERAPRAHAAMLEIAREAGLDEKRLSWTEPTREAGRDLVEHGGFDHVVFTGSTAVGREIAKSLAETLTPSALELSGSDSAIVLDDADAVLAARSIHFAISMNAGQTCMAPRRVIVESAVHEKFCNELRTLIANGANRRSISQAEADRCRDLIDQAMRDGAEPVLPEPTDDDSVATMAAVACPPTTKLAEGEHFGPALAVMKSESRDQTLTLARSASRSLVTAIFTRDQSRADAVARDLDAGFITINDCVVPTGHPGASVHGHGPSGWGITRGELGLLALTRPQFVSRTSSKVRAPTTPPTQKLERNMTRFVRRWYGR